MTQGNRTPRTKAQIEAGKRNLANGRAMHASFPPILTCDERRVFAKLRRHGVDAVTARAEAMKDGK